MDSDRGTQESDTDHWLNFVTFQVWFGSVMAGAVATTITGDGAYITFAPWLGLAFGVVANEITPGYVTTGIRVVK